MVQVGLFVLESGRISKNLLFPWMLVNVEPIAKARSYRARLIVEKTHLEPHSPFAPRQRVIDGYSHFTET